MKKARIGLIICLVVIVGITWSLYRNGGGFFLCFRLDSPEATLTRATPETEDDSLREAMFYQKLDDGWVRCEICFRRCTVPSGGRGFCRVRENRDGRFYLLVHSRPSAIHIDPIEKEPQLHNLPGTNILCIGTVGCNFRCKQCHNWHLSQSSPGDLRTYDMPPEKVVALALRRNVPTISFTYNDPIVFYEYVYDVAVLAKQKGLNILWHTNAAIEPEPLRKLLKYTDAMTVDLKGFSEEVYRQTFSGELAPVLRALKIIREEGVWLEIVNLIIPTINDDPDEIRKMCLWIKENLGEDVPVHFSRFVPAYRLTHLPRTPVKTLEMARKIAKDVGLHFVTIGNVPGHRYNSTFCPKCDRRLIHRIHFQVLRNNIKEGKCPFCEHKIPGIWK